MKREGNLYNQICCTENLVVADQKAIVGKAKQYGVIKHLKNRERNIKALNKMLTEKTYSTSAYKNFSIFEPKERLISALPYYPDRITHHAIMNIIEPLFTKWFTGDTYSCIKGRGIHAASFALRRALKDKDASRYGLKIDVRKFYPSVNHDVLKLALRRKIKDNDLLWLLDEIIDSAPGLPIGNYLSQYFANFYLTPFDYWIKQTMRAKHYFRYSDDMVILSNNKAYLHDLLGSIHEYLHDVLKLTLKDNWQVFPVAARGIDFVGYVHYSEYVAIRKSIKQNFARKVASGKMNELSFASYAGWCRHAHAKHLLKTLQTKHERIQGLKRTALKQAI